MCGLCQQGSVCRECLRRYAAARVAVWWKSCGGTWEADGLSYLSVTLFIQTCNKTHVGKKEPPCAIDKLPDELCGIFQRETEKTLGLTCDKASTTSSVLTLSTFVWFSLPATSPSLKRACRLFPTLYSPAAMFTASVCVSVTWQECVKSCAALRYFMFAGRSQLVCVSVCHS